MRSYGNMRRTIEEVCAAENMQMPSSSAELAAFVRECDARGITTNVSEEAWWKAARFEYYCPNHPNRLAASPSSNLCGPCLMGRPVELQRVD